MRVDKNGNRVIYKPWRYKPFDDIENIRHNKLNKIRREEKKQLTPNIKEVSK